MIDYGKQKSIISECAAHSTSVGEVQLQFWSCRDVSDLREKLDCN